MPPSTVGGGSRRDLRAAQSGVLTRDPRARARARRGARSARAGRARSPARRPCAARCPRRRRGPRRAACARGARRRRRARRRGRRCPRARCRRCARARCRRACRPRASRSRRRGRGSARRGWCRARARRGRVIAAGAVRAAARAAAPGAARRRARRPRSRRRRRRRGRRARRRARSSATGAMPAPSRPFELGQCATPVPRLAEARDLGGVDVHAVGEPDVVAEPAEPLEVLDRAAAEALPAELLLVDRLGEVRVQAHAARAGELGRLEHQLLGHRERRARRDGDARHRAGRGVVVAVDRLRRRPRGSRRDPRPPRPAAARPATRPRSIEPRHGWKRTPSPSGRVDLDARAGRRRRAGRGSGGRSSSSSPTAPAPRGPAVAAADCTSPSTSAQRRVQRDEPVEEVLVLRVAARRPLVQVVVAVDEARRREQARRRRSVRRASPAGAGPSPTATITPSVDHDVAARVLAAVRVDRRDRAALDHERSRHVAAIRSAASRTASRIFS